MDLSGCFALLLFGVLGGTAASTIKPDSELNTEETMIFLKRKLKEMEERQSSVETELRNELSEKMQEAEKRTLELKDEILKRVSEVEMRCQGSKVEILGRLQDAETRFLKADDQLLMAVLETQRTLSEISEKMQSVELQLTNALKTDQSKRDILEIQLNETKATLSSMVEFQHGIQDVIVKNISSDEKLKEYVNDRLTGFENIQTNLTAKMRTLESSVMNLEKNCASWSNVSRLDEKLQNLDTFTKTEWQSIKSQLLPHVKQLEEKSALHEDIMEINNTLQNHISEIISLNTELLDVQRSCDYPPRIEYGHPIVGSRGYPDRNHGAVVTYACRENATLIDRGQVVCRFGEWVGVPPECVGESCASEPPSPRNGKATDFQRKHSSNVRYECDRNFIMTANSTVQCSFGNWEGDPPVCSHFDATFLLRHEFNWPGSITCYSDDNYDKLKFSNLMDTGTGARLPSSVHYSKNPEEKSASIQLEDHGAYQCKYDTEHGSIKIVSLRQYILDIYPLKAHKVASIGDTVELTVAYYHSTNFTVRWKHNGVDVRTWDEKLNVTIPTVKSTDAGIYECFFEGMWNVSHALMRLIVRKCRENLYGKDCDQNCPTCYNGGICHDEWGMCICPAGFTGTNCEIACGKGRFGFDCSKSCMGEDCIYQQLCKPDPFGCACAPGFKGVWCGGRCDQGWYGADCKQPCHCARGLYSCNRFTGVCDGGCSPGWTGNSCQIKDVN